jgi:hypothetical protein
MSGTFTTTANVKTTYNNSLTKSFIDLATYDQHEQGMYGGNDAITYFVRKVVKATWFAKGIAQLTKGSTVTNWGSQQDIDFTISRAGDYLLNSWLRISLPSVSCNSAVINVSAGGVSVNIRWTRNLAHNLFSDYQMTFNDLQVDIKKGSHFYDFFTAFTVPASKRVGYDNMIGNVNALINPLADALDPDTPGLIRLGQLQAYTLNLPLITPFSRDTGVALPTAALPYNEMKFKFTVRPWSDLLIADALVAQVGGSTVNGGSYTFNAANSLVQIVQDTVATKSFGASQPAATYSPSLGLAQLNGNPLNGSLNIECFCEYAIVSNQERVRMGSCPRDILIEQSQQVTGTRMSAGALPTRQDIRFSYPVKALMFSAQNVTNPSEWSNYSCGNPIVGLNESGTNLGLPNYVNRVVLEGFRYDTDPISEASLLYENDVRYELPNDYFSLVAPYTNATSIPDRTGYHLYNYCLDLASVDPKGSTNYGKLTNATKVFTPSIDFANVSVANTFTASPNTNTTAGGQGVYFVAPGPSTAGQNIANAFAIAIVAVNHNFVRVSGGALGFPVL